jgi:hypothetical protein
MSHPICYSILAKILAGVSALALLAGSAAADPALTETFSINGSIQDAAHCGQFTLPDFDPTLGTLEGVDISLTIDSTAKIQVYNTAATPVGFADASLSLPGSVTGPGGIKLASTITASLDSGIAQPGLNTFGSLSLINTLSQHVDAGSLDLWQGLSGGLVDFQYSKGNPTYKGTDLGNSLFFGGAETGSGTFKVVYTYLNPSTAAVPEPSARFLSMIVAGLMGLMWFGRVRGRLRA